MVPPLGASAKLIGGDAGRKVHREPPYAELARLLGPEQPFYGLHAQGLEEGQEPLATIEEMAALYVDALRTVQPEGPYLLGGWSFGGVVAFEMARQLERRGEQVALLALVDSYVSGVTDVAPGLDMGDAASMRVLFARGAAAAAGIELPLADEALASMGDDELLSRLLDAGRKAGVLVPEAGLPYLRALRGVIESNLRALERYTPGAYGGPVLLVRASRAELDVPPHRGWAPFVHGGLVVEESPGDHHSMLRAPHVQALAERMRAHLKRAQGRKERAAGTADMA